MAEKNEKRRKEEWQKNGRQKNGQGKDCGGRPGALERQSLSVARPPPGASIRPPILGRFR